MKNAIDWIKSNPISVAAGVLAFLGILAFAYFLFIAAPAYRAGKAAELKEPETEQAKYVRVPVPLPNEDPNGEPIIENVVVNQRVIEEVREIYEKIKVQYDAILEQTNNKNADRHRNVMLGRGEIWPDADTNRFFDRYVKAKEDYLLHFKAIWTYVRGNPYNEGWNMPSMVGGSPPRPIEVQRELARTAFNFISSIGVTSAGELTQAQGELLYAEQRGRLMQMLTDRARQLHIYAALPDDQDPYAPKLEDLQSAPPVGGEFSLPGGLDGLTDPTSAAKGPTLPAQYPFDIAPWARASTPPTPDQLWEGQVELWIIRDVMQAIYDMNKVGEQVDVVNANGEIVKEWACVLNSPVKRLLKLDPLPGYVGLHTVGGVLEPSQIKAVTSAQGNTGIDTFTPAPGTDFSTDPSATPGGTTAKVPSVYTTPPAELAPLDPTDEAPEHFGITPTGRVSNSVFDVRHTRLIIDIESKKLPAFIEQLRKVNFMTVVGVNLEDVDEYDALRDGGYVYGDVDVVRAELIIESLWFRNWTSKYMPKIVKQKLLIIPPDDLGIGGFDPTGGAVPPSSF